MAFREFEAVAPGINRLVLVGQKRNLNYIKNKDVRFYTTVQTRDFICSKDCAAVVFHSLGDATLLKYTPTDKPIFWLGWGYDYYECLLSNAYPDGIILPGTGKLLASNPKPSMLRIAIIVTKSFAKWLIGHKARNQHEFFSKINFFSPVIESEYHMACQFNPWFKPLYISWNYGTVEGDFCTDNNLESPLGEDILVGNSATPENNHLEIFEALERHVDLTNRKIIVPLNYGDEWYKERIISIGKYKFGDQFVPLTNFLPKDAYIELLQNCGYVFMNHLRQQALGTICIMMLKGAKIYMNHQSPLYYWLIENGAVIESIDSAFQTTEHTKQTLKSLTEVDRLSNISIIKNHWGQTAQRQKTRHLIDIALGNQV